jgi:hypothetical protein
MEEACLEEYPVLVAISRRTQLLYLLVRSEICGRRQVLSGVGVRGSLIVGCSFCCNFWVVLPCTQFSYVNLNV